VYHGCLLSKLYVCIDDSYNGIMNIPIILNVSFIQYQHNFASSSFETLTVVIVVVVVVVVDIALHHSTRRGLIKECSWP
jgi:hypothetical protein